MRAYIVHESVSLDGLSQVNLPMPEPARDEVLVQIRAVSINYRDLLVIRGVRSWKPSGPRIVCSDGAGVVVAVGTSVRDLVIGDRVAGAFFPNWVDGALTKRNSRGPLGGANADGMLCEYRALPECSVVKLPSYLSYTEAATLPCAAVTAWNSVIEQAPLRPGQRVLVLGSGGVSAFALQFARMAGAEVIVHTRQAGRVDALRRLGAHDVVVTETVEKLADAWEAQGRGVDLVVDVLGGDLTPQVRTLRMGGRLSLIGNVNGFEACLDMNAMSDNRIDEVSVGSLAMFERMLAAMALHEMRPVIDRVFDFHDAAAAFKHFDVARSVGKVVIMIGGSISDR